VDEREEETGRNPYCPAAEIQHREPLQVHTIAEHICLLECMQSEYLTHSRMPAESIHNSSDLQGRDIICQLSKKRRAGKSGMNEH
jgi:hypothetical protein